MSESDEFGSDAETGEVEHGSLDVAMFHGLVGCSPAMRRIFRKLQLYGPAQAHVLISGETGTGKELIARALHVESDRSRGPFVALNCSALNDELFESELFGHEKGAFTGAFREHQGRFERANGGSLFLDEIGDMPARMQSKLLRVLEGGAIERVGGDREHSVDVRILSATNVPLEQAVQLGRFRSDLYHRVAVLHIRIPPLRERNEDIELLARHFLAALNRRYDRDVLGLTPEALRLLENYHWPGNARELRNVLERVFVETPGEVIGRKAFEEWEQERDDFAAGEWDVHRLLEREFTRPAWPMPGGGGPVLPPPRALLPPPRGSAEGDAQIIPVEALSVRLHQESHGASRRPKNLTEEAIRAAFEAAGGNATQAAESLGCHKTTLYRAIERLGLSIEELRGEAQE